MRENKKRKEVFILTETYKDNDPETIDTYDSMKALVMGLAEHVAEDVAADCGKKKPAEVARKVANVLATVIPGILRQEWACDDEGYFCQYGQSIYGYSVMDLQGVEDFGEKEDGEVDS